MTKCFVTVLKNVFEVIRRKFGGFIADSFVVTVPADGLAPQGARPSAGTVMTKFMCCIYCIYGSGIWRVKWFFITVSLIWIFFHSIHWRIINHLIKVQLTMSSKRPYALAHGTVYEPLCRNCKIDNIEVEIFIKSFYFSVPHIFWFTNKFNKMITTNSYTIDLVCLTTGQRQSIWANLYMYQHVCA